MSGFFKNLADRLAPKEVVREVILQPNRSAHDGQRIIAQVSRDVKGSLHLIIQDESETSLEMRITPETLDRLRELLAAIDRSLASTKPE